MKEKILMIDDDVDDVMLAKEAIASLKTDIQFTYLNGGNNIVGYFDRLPKQNLPDLILLDLNMPMPNGMEVLKEIKSHPDYSVIPVVIFTTSISEADRKECMRLKANSVVSKPHLFNYWGILIQSLCAVFLKECRD